MRFILILLFSITAANVFYANCAQPSYCNRACWGPNQPAQSSPAYTTVTHIVVHHTGDGIVLPANTDYQARMRYYWDLHVNTNGWADIGYNWLIDRNGVIYEGRGDGVRGAHFSGQNTGTVGICVIGDFTLETPSTSALNSLRDIIAWEASDKNVDVTASSFHAASGLNLQNLCGHRDGGSTICPGDPLYNQLPSLRTAISNLPCYSGIAPTLDCNNAVPLTCGVTYNGSSSNAPNAITSYGCNSWTETGPERVHTITPSHSGQLSAHLSNYTGDLDVYILGSCDPGDCLGTVYSDSAVVTNAVAGQTYYIVVDADDGSGSAYDLIVNCPSAPSILDCNNAVALSCGVTYSGASSSATSNVSSYGCNNSTQNGPERVHSITPLSNGSITAVVSNFTGDLDVFILESCDASDCSGIVFQDSAILANVVAGQTYYIVVDSDNGSGSSYDLVVNCQGQSGNNEDVVVFNAAITPQTVNAGGIVTANSDHTYTGDLYTTDLNNVNMDYFLSTDCNLSNDDVYLGGSISNLGVDNPSSNEIINISIPVNTSPGTYFILFAGDNGQDVTENDETNNVSCVQITVNGAAGNNDVSLSNVTTNTDSIVAGEVVDVSSNQNYNGNQTSNNLPSSELNYYLSTDCNLSPDDILLGDDVSNIGSDNTSSNETESLVIPINTESGTYYILFVADDNNAINESDENNNIECIMLVVDGEFVSINEKDLQNHISLYPNPTEGIITINSSEVNIQEIEIYNSNGLKLEDVEFINNEKIDLSPYANGIYYVRIVGESDERTTFKVIKQ